MNNLSNERLKELASGDAWTCVQDEEGQSMARELLALREAGKEPVGKFILWDSSDDETGPEMEWVESTMPGAIPLYAAPQLPAVPEYPELLPCPVLLEHGLRLGAGIKTSTLLEALSRRSEYYARLEAMTPQERAEHDAGIAAFKSLLDNAIAAAPKPE